MSLFTLKDLERSLVTNCDDCPLCAEACYCMHPGRPEGKSTIWDDNASPAPNVWHPSWCPLRKNALVIELAKPKPA